MEQNTTLLEEDTDRIVANVNEEVTEVTEVTENTPKDPSEELRTIDDKKILRIIHQHPGWRQQMIEEHRQDPINNPKPMTDAQFLRELHQIVPVGHPIVTADQARRIYALRARYENLKSGPQGFVPQYKTTNVIRSQVHAGTLQRLTPNELHYFFGDNIKALHFFWLEYVLRHDLGRWPDYTREEFRKKRKRGRPTAAESALIKRERQKLKKEKELRARQKEVVREKNRLSRAAKAFADESDTEQ